MDSTSGKHGFRSGYGPTATYRRRQPEQQAPRSGSTKQEEILSARHSPEVSCCCSVVSTVSSMEAADVCCCSQVCGLKRDVASQNVGESGGDHVEESESGWTTYLLHQSDYNTVCRRGCNRGKPKSISVTASQLQDSSSMSSDASSGPARALQEDHSTGSRFIRTTRKRPRTNIDIPDGSLLLEDPEELAIGGAFDAVETRLCVLQKLIPNGDRLDHEEMLDKAIEYVHSLEQKIQIFKSRILAAGVCVMPLSVLRNL